MPALDERDLPELPTGWAWYRLADTCSTTSGGTPSRARGEYFQGDIPWVKSGELRDGLVTGTEEHISPEALESCSAKMIERGAVLIALYGATVGRTAVLRIRAAANQAVCAIAARPGIEAKYVYWFLVMSRPHLLSIRKGGAQPNISQQIIRELQMPVPPPNEQQRIVDEIDKQFSRLDAGVAALERVRAGLKRYRAAVLQAACTGRLVPAEAELARAEGREATPSRSAYPDPRARATPTPRRAGRLWGSGVVPELTEAQRAALPEGWQWAKVTDVGVDPEDAVQVGPMSMRSQDFEADGVPVLNVGCVQWGTFHEHKLNFLPREKALAFERYRVRPGDVLFTRSGTVGRCAVVRSHQAGWLITFHLLRVRPEASRCLPEFLRIVFEGAPHIRQQTRDASIGTTRAGFNTPLLQNLDVPLPPLAEQQRIVAEVERRLSVVDELEALVAANLKRADRLRQAILKRAFEGQLVPQDPNDEPAGALLERIRREREADPGRGTVAHGAAGGRPASGSPASGLPASGGPCRVAGARGADARLPTSGLPTSGLPTSGLPTSGTSGGRKRPP